MSLRTATSTTAGSAFSDTSDEGGVLMAKEKHEQQEHLMLHKDGRVLQTLPNNPDHTIDFEIVEDTTDEEGIRTLRIQKTDTTEFDTKRKKLITRLLEALGEPRSRILRKLLDDVLIEYWPDSLDDLYQRVVVRGEPVKAKEGCFKLVVGDARRADHCEIMLRGGD